MSLIRTKHSTPLSFTRVNGVTSRAKALPRNQPYLASPPDISSDNFQYTAVQTWGKDEDPQYPGPTLIWAGSFRASLRIAQFGAGQKEPCLGAKGAGRKLRPSSQIPATWRKPVSTEEMELFGSWQKLDTDGAGEKTKLQ